MQEYSTIELIFTALILIVFIAASLTILLYIHRRLERLAKKTKTKLDDYVVALAKWPLLTTFLLLGVSASLSYWSSKFPGSLPIEIETNIEHLLYAGVILASASVLSIIVQAVISKVTRKIVVGDPDKETIFLAAEKIVTYAIYLLSFIIILSIIFPPSITAILSLLTGAGFIAIVVGLAAQKVIGNWLSGIIIQVSRPFRIGDHVLFRGDYGMIEEITLRHTIIRTWDNRRLIVPNSVFDSEVIVNYFIKDPTMIGMVFIDVPYETDIDLAKKVMIETAASHPNVLKDMTPMVHLLEFGENGAKLRLIFRAKDQPTAFATAADLRMMIKKEFAKHGIEISYPRRYIIMSDKDRGAQGMERLGEGE